MMSHPRLSYCPGRILGKTGSCAVPAGIYADPGNRVVPAAGGTSRLCCAEMPLKHSWVSWTTNEDADQCNNLRTGDALLSVCA